MKEKQTNSFRPGECIIKQHGVFRAVCICGFVDPELRSIRSWSSVPWICHGTPMKTSRFCRAENCELPMIYLEKHGTQWQRRADFTRTASLKSHRSFVSVIAYRPTAGIGKDAAYNNRKFLYLFLAKMTPTCYNKKCYIVLYRFRPESHVIHEITKGEAKKDV